MGYNARFVVGRMGSVGHAWVTFEKNGKYYVAEPSYRVVGDTFPSLSTIRFHPRFSVSWDGKKISFYAHRDLASNLKFSQIPFLLRDWIIGWGYFWFRVLLRLPWTFWSSVFKKKQR